MNPKYIIVHFKDVALGQDWSANGAKTIGPVIDSKVYGEEGERCLAILIQVHGSPAHIRQVVVAVAASDIRLNAREFDGYVDGGCELCERPMAEAVYAVYQ